MAMAYGSTLTIEQDAPEIRKERGAFFTPPRIADFMCERLIDQTHTTIFEPSCGEAEFLRAACLRLCRLGISATSVSQAVTGCELHALSADAAEERLAKLGFTCTIARGDFLTIDVDSHFDVIVGNPPYVRFQVIDDATKAIIQDIALRHNVKISSLASLWVPFLLRSCELLRQGGNLGMVLPAELLTVNYASSVRSYLLNHFSQVELFTFEQRIFPEVQEEVILLFAYGFELGATDAILWHQCQSMNDAAQCSPRMYQPGDPSNRWSGGLVLDEAQDVLSNLVENGLLVELGDWGTISLGAVTGCNDYFALSEKAVTDALLTSDDVQPLCPPGSNHLRRLAFTRRDLDELQRSGKRVYLFYPSDDSKKPVQRYLERGKELAVDKRYKCRKRTPWWRVPSVSAPDAMITYMNGYAPNIVSNEARVVHLNSCHGLYFFDQHHELGALLPVASFNVATLLSAELTGRSYGGGVLKLEPREAARWLVPSPDFISDHRSQLSQISSSVDALLRERRYEEANAAVTQTLLSPLLGNRSTQLLMREHKALLNRRKNRSGKASL